jgi:hypothetical protein
MNKKIILPFIFAFLLLISFVSAAFETYNPTDKELVDGYVQDFKLSDRAVFKFENMYPTFMLYMMPLNSAVFRIYTTSSSFIEKEMFVGDVWRVDLNNDEIYDFQLTLESRISNVAKMTIKYIHEDINLVSDNIEEPVVELVTTNNAEEEPEVTIDPIGALDLNNTENNDETEEGSSYLWIWMVLVLVIIAIAVIVYYVNKPKKKFRY